MANILLFVMVNHITPRVGKTNESHSAQSGISQCDSVGSSFGKFLGLTPHQPGENPKDSRRDEQQERKTSYPPVWTRVPSAIFLGLWANVILIVGMLRWDDKGRFWRAAFIGLALLIFVGGLGLGFTLTVPATWGWWLYCRWGWLLCGGHSCSQPDY